MAMLNQLVAIEKGLKSRVYSEITDLDKAAQKPDLFNGFVKTYASKEEGDEELPSEGKRVQYEVGDVLRSVERLNTEYFDVTARKDWTNCVAKADVVVDSVTIIQDAPVSYLLFMEKQLTDMRTFVSRLPVLDDNEQWDKDNNSGLYKTNPIKTHRTKKVQKPIVLYHATTEHAAQTQLVTEDIIAGYWTQVKHSGAMPKPVRAALVTRVDKLLQAVKQAREEANTHEETQTPNIDQAVFGYLFSHTE